MENVLKIRQKTNNLQALLIMLVLSEEIVMRDSSSLSFPQPVLKKVSCVFLKQEEQLQTDQVPLVSHLSPLLTLALMFRRPPFSWTTSSPLPFKFQMPVNLPSCLSSVQDASLYTSSETYMHLPSSLSNHSSLQTPHLPKPH